MQVLGSEHLLGYSPCDKALPGSFLEALETKRAQIRAGEHLLKCVLAGIERGLVQLDVNRASRGFGEGAGFHVYYLLGSVI